MPEFADYVDGCGRYVRQWWHGSGQRPLMEVAEAPDGFEPPYGSAGVLVMVGQCQHTTVMAAGPGPWGEAALAVAMWRIDNEA